MTLTTLFIILRYIYVDSRNEFDTFMRGMKAKYEVNKPDVYKKWIDFAETVPESDNVQSYVTKEGLHVPFREKLFPSCFLNGQSVLAVPIHRLQQRASTQVT